LIIIYNILLHLSLFILLPVIFIWVLASEKRRKTVRYRLGPSKNTGPFATQPVWFHALSVGEVLSAIPLIKKTSATYPELPIFLTVTTRTGHETALHSLDKHTVCIDYFPFDHPLLINRMVRRIDPALVVILESDLWPNFLHCMKKNQRPVILVNARLSKKSWRGYRRFGFFFRPMFRSFDQICTQSEIDRQRFETLGLDRQNLTLTGSLKFDRSRSVLPEDEIHTLRKALRINPNQKILVAGSTHPGEETILLQSFAHLRHRISHLRLILVPRDPQRAGDIRKMARDAGFSEISFTDCQLKASEEPVDVVVVDTIGVLEHLYAFCDLAFVGGSLITHGGQNPLEPASHGKPILFGPHMTNFPDIAEKLVTAGGARYVNPENFVETASAILSETVDAKAIGERAQQVFYANQGACDKTVAIMAPYLNR